MSGFFSSLVDSSFSGNASSTNSSLDSFQRVRISQPFILFDDTSEYGLDTDRWETSSSGTGTNLSVTNQSAIRISTGGTGSGAYFIKQSRYYCRYQAGASHICMLSFTMSTTANNSVARVGYFDDNDGLFLSRATDTNGATTVSLVRRTYTSGSPVDNSVAQSSWNLDTMTGSGSSGAILDLTKTQILVIDFQWLGVGRVRMGFDIDGQVVWVHEFLHANNLSTVYMRSGTLPVRYEVRNTGVANGTITMDTICALVASEAPRNLNHNNTLAVSNGVTAKGTTNNNPMIPVLSIRAATTGKNKLVRSHAYVIPKQFHVSNVGTGTVYYEIRINPGLTGASFTSAGTLSAADYDTSATAFSSTGTIVESGYVLNTNQFNSEFAQDFFEGRPLVYTGLNNTQDILTIGVVGVGVTTSVLASITWKEE